MTTIGVTAALAAVVPLGAAAADTSPPVGTPATVSADALPTWQVNGVVWRQVIVGNTVYATGNFTQARPPGVAVGGAGSVAANSIFAYDITTGARVSSFSHSLNGQGLDITRSPDGSRVYVVGDFTTVDGVAHSHIAAFNTATGALDNTFSPSLSNTTEAVTASNTTVWVGGNFFKANTSGRNRLAAFSASTGATLPWAPSADDNEVTSMVLSPDGSRVIIGGKFTTLNGASAPGMGAVDAVSGASRPWAANQRINDSGNGSAIDSLRTDGTYIYGSGYAFQSGNFEGSFVADPNTGNLILANDCHGDTYDVAPLGGVLYTVSHAHDCRWIGGFPQTDADWSINMRHALAFTTSPTTTNIGPDNYGWNYSGIGASSLLQWFPEVAIGNFTGQNQAAWSVTGNSDYVVLGGEFPRVNGVNQQGLARFAMKPLAPNKVGPVRAPGAPVPTAQSFSNSTARIAWQSAYDMDNATLTYELYRSGTTLPIYTTTQDSNYWTYPMMGFVDHGATPGTSYTYRIKVIDPSGNNITLPTTNSVTIQAGAEGPYSKDVVADGATAYWRLGEASGTTVYDHAGFNDATASSGVTRGAPGAIQGDQDGASTFSGNSTGFVASPAMTATPSFSIETWIKTDTTQGGKIVGYGAANTGDSGSYDRHLYMDNAGHLVFGVYPGGVRTVSTAGTYNDNNWHHVVATLDSGKGMVLYVDGKKVAADAGTTSAQVYQGYWRIGGDNLNGWPSQPASNYIRGQIDDVAIYPSALTLSRVQQHYVDSGRSLALPPAPTDTYGKAVVADSPDFYYRLGDASGPTAKDSSGNQLDGSYSGGETFGQPGAVPGTSDTAVLFDGTSGTVASAGPVTGPTTYSEEVWFKTTTTHGGKLIGFGDQPSGLSSNYDRHVYMENSGQLTFGVWTGQANTITSAKSYNDGAWHHLVATQGSDGMTLYVDGAAVGTNAQTQAQAYSGYWRLGGDSSWGGDSPWFAGYLDEAAVYSSELTADQVKAHYRAGGGTVANVPPTGAFTATSTGLKVAFDASSSTDSDGTISSYSWDFGDGSTGSGVSPSHSYASDGTYAVALTVTDDRGGQSVVTHAVTVANQPPSAAFNSSVDQLQVSVDGSGSSDPDGTVASYSWNWGDGSPADSGAQATHTYGSEGSYTVNLTVTDDHGATATVSHVVTVVANKPPTAAFTATVNQLSVAVDGTGSSDADGTVKSYAWNWGDGTAPGSGVTASHTYTSAGTFTVTLTVTDDRGATTAVSHQVTTVAVTLFAKDTFARTVSSGWGTADLGGAWTRTGTATNFAVSNGVGTIKMPNSGSGPSVALGSVSSTSTDLTFTVAADKAATGGGIYLTGRPRLLASGDNYYGEAQLLSTGGVALSIGRVVGGTETVLQRQTVAGLTAGAGAQLNLRVQAFGTSPTTVRAKVWLAGTTEPAAWTVSTTDAAASLQTPGGIGLAAYLSGTSTNAPVVSSWTNLLAGVVG
jgi:PKD repeat protein